MSRRLHPRAAMLAGLALGSLLLSACGIPMQDSPQPLPSGAVPTSIVTDGSALPSP